MAGTRNYALAMGAGVAVLLSGLVGAAALSGALSASQSHPSPRLVEKTATAAAARKADCRVCGVVQSVRVVELAAASSEALSPFYRITIRMDDGTERTLSSARAPGLNVGERVRIKGNALERG